MDVPIPKYCMDCGARFTKIVDSPERAASKARALQFHKLMKEGKYKEASQLPGRNLYEET
jgi:hypothetical protein